MHGAHFHDLKMQSESEDRAIRIMPVIRQKNMIFKNVSFTEYVWF